LTYYQYYATIYSMSSVEINTSYQNKTDNEAVVQSEARMVGDAGGRVLDIDAIKDTAREVIGRAVNSSRLAIRGMRRSWLEHRLKSIDSDIADHGNEVDFFYNLSD